MKAFDPLDERSFLLGRNGYEWVLQAEFNEAKAVGGLASSADAFLNKAVACILVGFDEPAERLAKKAKQWVEVAISDGERPRSYAPNYTESSRLRKLALIRWLLESLHDTESYDQMIAFQDQNLDTTSVSRDRLAVSLLLPWYLDAGAYARALEIFTEAGISRPKNLRNITGEAKMCYVLARHRLGLEYTTEEVSAAVKRFLDRNVNPSWLSNGNWVRAAEWMKIVYWNGHEGDFSPRETVLKCYDHLPVPPPADLTLRDDA